MDAMTTPFLFCFGMGYSALCLARAVKAEGWRVEGTSRDAAKRETLAREGLVLHEKDYDLTGVTHILVSIPPGTDGDPIVGKFPSALPDLRWLGYLSTTGVYGDRAGGWVDEGSALRPTSDRARQRVEAERRWLGLYQDRGWPVHVFRLAGIYGPGRSALDQARDGGAQRIVKPGQVFSRIHVEDIASVLRASMERPRP
ncbi:MAG: NAD(P)-dependent oxidoreductase, partial [Alphaproteobacteria bacterium RIFOXYD12_FULL_60_8]